MQKEKLMAVDEYSYIRNRVFKAWFLRLIYMLTLPIIISYAAYMLGHSVIDPVKPADSFALTIICIASGIGAGLMLVNLTIDKIRMLAIERVSKKTFDSIVKQRGIDKELVKKFEEENSKRHPTQSFERPEESEKSWDEYYKYLEHFNHLMKSKVPASGYSIEDVGKLIKADRITKEIA